MRLSLTLLVPLALYSVLISISPLFSNKLVPLFGGAVMAGTLVRPLTAGLLDVVNNVYGRETAKQMVLTAAICRLVLWGISLAMTALPTYSEPAGFDQFFRTGVRIIVAGEVSLLTAQYLIDTRIFDWVRRRFKGGFWLRYNVSTLISQTVERAIYIPLALAFTGRPLWKVFYAQTWWWLLTTVLLTPVFAYIAARMAKAVDQ